MELIAKGLGVSPGKIKGKVKIIGDMADHKNFQEDEILITHITDPTMVPIMNDAAGIICNIGGMTSHPSIVSRELGIPCIVSAKSLDKKLNITEVLIDGDEITMDGKTGEIFRG